MREEISIGEGDVVSGLAFKNGKAIWSLYTVERVDYNRDESGRAIGELVTMYRVDIASDGTVTAYPNDKAYIGAGAF